MADTGRRAPFAPRNNPSNDAPSSDSLADETRMRRALGLGTGGGHPTPQQRPEQAPARHRFVQDGGVPVVMLNAKAEPETAALRERIAALEGQLETERAAHGLTRRQLETEHHAVTALQTRIAHNDPAHKDALDQERRLREAAQAALQEALANAPARRHRALPVQEPEPDTVEDDRLQALDLGPAHAAKAQPAQPDTIPADTIQADTIQADEGAEASAEVPAAALGIAPQEKRPRGRPRSTTPAEPKPVRWWTPSYRAKKP